MRWLLVALLACGCRQIFGLDTTVLSDGGADVSPPRDVGDAESRFCFGTPYAFCFDALPSGDLSLGGPINTDTYSGCVAYSTTAPGIAMGDGCVIAAKTIQITMALKATGGRALILVATDNLTVGTNIDAASHVGVSSQGAGAEPPSCTAGTSASGGGGGAGGSYGGVGANGGNDNTGAGQGTPGTSGTLRFLGGCRGQFSGGALGTTAGFGGGAVVLVAGSTLSINAAINVSGGSGAGGMFSGGGGGGSGGTIALEATSLVMSGGAQLFANGGAGGEGSGGNAGNSGVDSTGPTIAAVGGSGGSVLGGDGGRGGTGAVDASAGGDAMAGGTGAGGGGGGGGVGMIVYHADSSTLSGMVSPSPISI